jgi:hypothetical protein
VTEPQLELSRPIEVSRIPPTGSAETIIAEPKERVDDRVERYFLPGGDSADEEADVDSFENEIIELGEVVVECLSLALDPYPRKPGAVFHATEEVAEEGGSSPFAELAALRSRKR